MNFFETVNNKIFEPLKQFLYLLATDYLNWLLSFIACFVILIIVLIWLIFKNKKQQQELARLKYKKNSIESLSDDEIENIAQNVSSKETLLQNLQQTKDEADAEMKLNYPIQAKPKKTTSKPKATKKTKTQEQAQVEEVEQPTEEQAPIEEPKEEVKQPPKKQYVGKWKICKEDDKFYAILIASNGGQLLKTTTYSSLTSLKSGIETLKRNVEADNFVVSIDKNGLYRFKLFTKQGKEICQSEGYSSKAKCDGGINSVKRFANSDNFVREEN